jgi:hypothetical protein
MLLIIVQWQRIHKVRGDLDAVKAPMNSCWNYDATNVAPVEERFKQYGHKISSKNFLLSDFREIVIVLVISCFVTSQVSDKGDKMKFVNVKFSEFHLYVVEFVTRVAGTICF